MAKILITGAGGYLGSRLVPYLLTDPRDQIVAIDNFRHGIDSLASIIKNPRLSIFNVDARDVAAYAMHVVDADVVIPLAAIVGQKACDADKELAYTTNFGQIRDIRERMTPRQFLIYPCTNSGYGVGGSEECDELSPLNPVSAYGETKVLGEEEALRHPHAVSLRFATLFGMSPRMRLDLLVNDFTYQAVRNNRFGVYQGAFRRNFVHVHDACGAISHAIWMRHDSMKSGIFNVGNTEANMTKSRLAFLIANQTGCDVFESSGEDPDKRDYLVSNAKIEATGWRPTHSLRDGIIEMRDHFEAMPYSNPGYKN